VSTIAWHAARLGKRRPRIRAFCELDGWSFDPRYTEGRCPICGWVAPNAPEAPLWLTLARRFEWELAGLVVLMAVLAIIAVAVVHAAGYRLPWSGAPVHAAPATIASQARTNASPPTSPSSHSPKATISPKPSGSPSKTP
jgi:hypothetical protein